MLEFLTLYWLIGFALPPILFLIWNQWDVSRISRRTLRAWEENEEQWIREWALDVRAKADEELLEYTKRSVQSSLLLAFAFLLNLFFLPAISVVFTLGTLPYAGWLVTAFLLHLNAKNRADRLGKEGFPFRKIATHKRIQDELKSVTEYKDGIIFPYLFIKSYQRSTAIHTEIAQVIRTVGSAEEAKQRFHRLTVEEESLMRDMNAAIMGRPPKSHTG